MHLHRKQNILITIFSVLLISLYKASTEGISEPGLQEIEPKSSDADEIIVVLLARNKGHTLPYFLTLFQNLNYPKNKLSLYIRADHCEDNTIRVLEKWLHHQAHFYNATDVAFDKYTVYYKGEKHKHSRSKASVEGIIKLKEDALHFTLNSSARYALFLDVDIFLTNPDVILNLIAKRKTIISPRLRSLHLYSNFRYNNQTQSAIVNYKKGCYDVSLVQSFILIDLQELRNGGYKLSFDPRKSEKKIGFSDLQAFEASSQAAGVNMTVCIDGFYGFITHPLHEKQGTPMDELKWLRVSAANDEEELPMSSIFRGDVPLLPTKSKIGFDEIYVINLLRRPERKQRMGRIFDELGVDVRFVQAIDGRELNQQKLEELEIKPLQDYIDPYKKRTMKFGEVGCFLSHYEIWNDILQNNYDISMVLEDDIVFEYDFKKKMRDLMEHVKNIKLDWDLIYLGRNRIGKDRSLTPKSNKLVLPGYSYWTIGYIISKKGAQMLVDSNPLEKLLPVDEFLPIMFDRHPNTTWMNHFSNRNLSAYSATPLLIKPTPDMDNENYSSDTDWTNLING